MIHSVRLAIDTAWLITGQIKERVEGLEKTFQQGGAHQISTVQIVLWCVVAASLGLLLWRVARAMAEDEGRRYDSTNRLFRDLCRLHQLDWPSHRLLRSLARAHDLDPPTRLFIEPNWFNERDLPAPLHRFRTRLAEIKYQLFGREESLESTSNDRPSGKIDAKD